MTQPNYRVWDKMKEEERARLYHEQEKFCKRQGSPIFITEDGVCLICHKNYLDMTSEKEASTTIITNCKLCNASFVD